MLPAAIGAVVGGSYAFYYRGTYDPPVTPEIGLDQITRSSRVVQGFGEAPTQREGLFLLDEAHFNQFETGELDSLLGRIGDTGYAVEVLERLPGAGARLAQLDSKLREADSFAVAVPGVGYSEAEVELVKEFVRKGGRLLLVGDPSRDNQLNSLAEPFGMVFRQDFLYNMVENESNFANVFIRNFEPHAITQGLREITLYTAGSIRTSGTGLAFGDQNTYSYNVERTEPLSPLAQAAEGDVVGVSDLTFFLTPQNAVSDNSHLIANLAAYLTQGDRSRDLADFPHFFQDDVDILVISPDLFSLGTEVRELLADFQIPSAIGRVEDFAADTVFLGLYQDAAQVTHYLGIGGVGVAEALRTPFTPDIDPTGTAVLLLQQEGERKVLVILGHSPGELAFLMQALRTGQFRAGLVGDLLGVYG